LEQLIRDFMEQNNIPGMSIAITRDDKIVLAKGFGLADREAQQPVTVRSRFRTASIAKPITATAIFVLIECGQLRLDDQVFGAEGVLGDLYLEKSYDPRLAEITIDHLLSHTSGGWAAGAEDPMFSNPELNHAQLIQWTLRNRPLEHEPGTTYAYSNFGYCLLGRIIETIMAVPYADAAKRLVLEPCGVTDMEIAGNTKADRQDEEVVYYGQDGDDPYDKQLSRMDSHGGWIATASDLARFVVRVNGFPDEPDILQPETIRTMTSASSANPGYARGWAGNDTGSWWHGGSFSGTSTVLVRTATGVCWVALTNTRKPGLGLELDKMMWKAVERLDC
jgi:CubicO group peptidase (beta-lactamase class C family)